MAPPQDLAKLFLKLQSDEFEYVELLYNNMAPPKSAILFKNRECSEFEYKELEYIKSAPAQVAA